MSGFWSPSRSLFLLALPLLLLVFAVGGCAPTGPAPEAPAAPAPPPVAKPAEPVIPEASAARTAALYEAAKKEGKVLLYTTGTAKEADQYKKPFEAKYPGIEVEYFTGTSEDIANKITAEARAGKTIADMVVMTLGGGWGALLKEGLVAKYLSPELKSYPKGTYQPEGLYTFENYTVYVIAYNTNLVSPAEAPKSFQDVLNPKWKGKIAVEADAHEWFVYMQKWMGREKALDYMKQLAPLAQLRKGHTVVAELVQAGEFAVSPTTYQHRIQQQMDKGAPIKWVANKPTFAFPRAAGLTKNAPHPNAAQLFLDWRLTEEGQQVSVKQNRVPVRTGVNPDPPSLKEGVEYFPAILEIDELVAQEQKYFREIFGAF